MTKEDKELLLKDLCARLPYNVMVDYEGHIYMLNEIDPACKDIDYITVRIQDEERLTCAKSVTIEKVKPYLRPMSSMTEEEKNIQKDYIYHFSGNSLPDYEGDFVFEDEVHEYIDWLNAHHFDYRGLIGKGLAMEAPEGTYNNN